MGKRISNIKTAHARTERVFPFYLIGHRRSWYQLVIHIQQVVIFLFVINLDIAKAIHVVKTIVRHIFIRQPVLLPWTKIHVAIERSWLKTPRFVSILHSGKAVL